ncbi:hypothetical protein [Rhodopirellula sp. MGV]|uniref:hypothetical protein n=1 Tax=Rhodopirellula sp. MGV TaxID=2023130 RepID=UPI000B95E900|nr:hypothetical protein [Rhodopirellula sp. MGV]OYP34139.1 hypothetical protein CGZ80_15880 [Rhodopirellula sp. MGV]PNY33575.1 hypothetical protein C2E31_27605 [Rhodopirellula baltica]
MDGLQNAKFVQVIAPGAIVDNASFTTAEIDTAGYDYLTLICNVGATDIAMAAMKLQASHETGTGFVDVDGLDMDGDTDAFGGTAALPSATDDNSLVVFQADLKKGNYRYWDLVATAGDGSTGTYLSVVAILTEGERAPNTAAQYGVETLLRN